MTAQQRIVRDAAAAVFERLDLNRDGVIDRREWQLAKEQAAGGRSPELIPMTGRYDQNRLDIERPGEQTH